MGRTRTVLGLALIVIGTILLSRALLQPLVRPLPDLPPPPAIPDIPPMSAMPEIPPLPDLPRMPDMPPLPAMPAMPDLPPLPAIPPVPPVPPMHQAPFFHWGAWFSPPVLILLLLLAVFWLRQRGTRERPLA
jgi:hypothetical protein